MLRYLPLIVKNSLRNRRRSALTIGSIAISLCLLGVLMALYRAMFLAGPTTPAQALRAVVHHRVSITQPLPISYMQMIARVPGVRELTTWQWFGGVYRDERDQSNFFARFAVDPDKLLAVRPELKMPEDEQRAFIHERTGCIVGRLLVQRFGWKLGDRITLKGDIFPVDLEFKIVGIYDNPEESETMYFNREYLRESMLQKQPARADQTGAFLVMASSEADVPRISRAIDDMFANSTAQTRTESEQAFALSFASMLGNIKLFLMLICSAITFTILLVSANTISMSVRERVREVAILKTLGYTPGAILGIILGEAAFISIIGGALGCLMAQGLCVMMHYAPAYVEATRTLSLTPGVGLLSLGVAALIGVVSSLFPAWNASRKSILDSLRYAG